MSLPNDPIILLSYINTKLRDEYPTLDELCYSLDYNRTEIENKLSAVNYNYNEDRNQFTVA